MFRRRTRRLDSQDKEERKIAKVHKRTWTMFETYSTIYPDSKFAENTTKSRAKITSPESRHMDGFTTYSTCSRLRIILHIRSERERDPSRLISNTLIPGEQTILNLYEFDSRLLSRHHRMIATMMTALKDARR